MKIVVENIFMCLVLFWKCYFPTNFSRFLGYFLSIQTNFITENFKITITTTKFSRFLGYFLDATTTPPQQQQKSKSQREIGGSKVRMHGGEIARRRDRAARCCGRHGAIDKIWCVQSSNWSSGFAYNNSPKRKTWHEIVNSNNYCLQTLLNLFIFLFFTHGEERI